MNCNDQQTLRHSLILSKIIFLKTPEKSALSLCRKIVFTFPSFSWTSTQSPMPNSPFLPGDPIVNELHTLVCKENALSHYDLWLIPSIFLLLLTCIVTL